MHITITNLERTVSFGNKAWGEDLKVSDSHTNLTQAIGTYLLPVLSFSSGMATFEIFEISQGFVLEQCLTGVLKCYIFI